MLVKVSLVTFALCLAAGNASAQVLLDTIPGHGPGVVVVDFDELQGQIPFEEGNPVQRGALIDTLYLDQGLLFDAPGGGIFVAASQNSISLPNAAGATAPGPVTSFSDPSTATFWKDSRPATVGYLSISTSRTCTFRLYDLHDHRFATGTGTHIIFQGNGLHRVEIGAGSLFDDFTFDELQAAQGFGLSPVLPGRAGTTNQVHLSGGTPGETVLVALGLDQGSHGASLPSTFRTLRTARLDADGRATVSFDVPAACAGLRLTARGFATSGDTTQTVRDWLAPLQ